MTSVDTITSDIQQLEDYITALPKIELHAHLSGSIRQSTIVELIHQHYPPQDVEKQVQLCKLQPLDPNEKRDLNECFALFKVLHRIVSSRDILHRITLEVLEDFIFDDKVMYIELRTTPRAITNDDEECFVSKSDYVEIILRAMEEFRAIVSYVNTFNANQSLESSTSYIELEDQQLAGFSSVGADIIRNRLNKRESASWFVNCSLLLSIDRSKDIADAEETLDIAVAMRQKYFSSVRGIDFSGNPFAANFNNFIDVFNKAKFKYNFKISVHFAETNIEQDSIDILRFRPDRLGHAAVLTQHVYDVLIQSRIPVEICVTSNMSCKLHTDLITHPLLSLHKHRHTVVLCTDDKGVFGCTLNDEWKRLLRIKSFNHHGEVCLDQIPSCTTNCHDTTDAAVHDRDNCVHSLPLSPNSIDEASLFPQAHVTPYPTTLYQAKHALYEFALMGVSACFADGANMNHMINTLKLYRPVQ